MKKLVDVVTQVCDEVVVKRTKHTKKTKEANRRKVTFHPLKHWQNEMQLSSLEMNIEDS